jgi:single-strand DNA-binding protein
MSDTITITGLVATPPRHILTSEGLSITSFRLASTQRRFDRSQERWIDGETNWYTITSFRQLALNCSTSVEKGQRVLVTGRLRIREWDNGERVGTTIEVEADSIGHDLMWGTASFSRSIVSSSGPAVAEHAPEVEVEVGSESGDGAPRAEDEAELAVDVATPF